VLDECRESTLSEDNHAFLHFKNTTVPGSWESAINKAACGVCDGLKSLSPADIRQQECTVCKAERRRRARVVGSIPDDKRLQHQFNGAVSIVANNDLKYDICKRRAAEYARNTKQRILWRPAYDVACSAQLQKKLTLQLRKRHG